MGKKSGRLLLILKRILKYLLTVAIKLIKTIIQSVMICVPIVFTFMIINVCLGVHMKFSFYSKLAGWSILVVSLILCIVRYEAIFIKHAKTSKKKTVPTNKRRKTQRNVQGRRRKTQRTVQRKRKIS